MKPEIKNQWLEALRSGNFVQAKEFLNRGDAQCCLGVLCILAEREGVVISENAYSSNKYGIKIPVVRYIDPTSANDAWNMDQSDSGLPRAVQKWAGLPDANPSVRVDLYSEDETSPTTLAELNDDYDFSFEKIADVIEREL